MQTVLGEAKPKLKRTEDRRLLNWISELPCLACGRPGPSDPHHVKSVGSGGPDVRENVVPLCREHHSEFHSRGMNKFAAKYPAFNNWLKMAGWRQDLVLMRWVAPF